MLLPWVCSLVAAHAAFRSGAVMGFLLAGFGLLNLFLGIMLFKWVRGVPWGFGGGGV